MKGGAFWILGILLLVGMFFGVRTLFDGSGAKAKKDAADANEPLKMIVAWGNFDVEKGVAFLYPRQSGNVEFIHKENKDEDKPLKKGTVLLQVEDKLMRLKLKEAELDVKAGEKRHEEAKKLTELYRLQKLEQSSAINAITSEIKTTERDRDNKLKLLKDDPPDRTKQVNDYYKDALDLLQEKKKAAEAKLEQIKLQDADLKITQAEYDLEARKERLTQAQEMLKHFQITAPSDGYVLRTHVHEGETLGPNPRIHALEFLPEAPIVVRAEVLQEWGRYVKPGATVTIEDDTFKGPEWKGEVKSISKWYATVRNPIIEPFRYNDVRTLECIIELKDGPCQRVRAKIDIK